MSEHPLTAGFLRYIISSASGAYKRIVGKDDADECWEFMQTDLFLYICMSVFWNGTKWREIVNQKREEL